MDLFFEYELDSDEIVINALDEIKEVIWVKPSEIEITKIGFVSIRKVIAAQYCNL
jgi:NAD+ diphosphatase